MGRSLRESIRTGPPSRMAMQRLPSSLRSKIHPGSLNRSFVRTAFIASACSGAFIADLLESAAGLDRLGPGADRVAPRVGLRIAALEQQPLGLGPAARALERPAAGQLLPVQPELRVAGLELLGHRALLVEVAVAPRVPHDHRSGAVARPPDHALEVAVGERVVLDLDGEPLLARIGRRPLRNRPRLQHAVDLEPEVVVQRRRRVLVDDEAAHAPARRRLMSEHSRHTVSGMTPARISSANTWQPMHTANADSSVAATTSRASRTVVTVVQPSANAIAPSVVMAAPMPCAKRLGGPATSRGGTRRGASRASGL